MIEIYRLTPKGYILSRSIDAPRNELKWQVIDFLAFQHSATSDELKAQFGNTAALQGALNGLLHHKPPIMIREGREAI